MCGTQGQEKTEQKLHKTNSVRLRVQLQKEKLPKPAKKAQLDSKKSSLLSSGTSEKFHLYLESRKTELPNFAYSKCD